MAKIYNFQLKNIKIYNKKSTRVYCDIYFKNKKIGEFSNDGDYGESYYELYTGCKEYENKIIKAFQKFNKYKENDELDVVFFEKLLILSICEKHFKKSLKKGFKKIALLKFDSNDKISYKIVELNNNNDMNSMYKDYSEIYFFNDLADFIFN